MGQGARRWPVAHSCEALKALTMGGRSRARSSHRNQRSYSNSLHVAKSVYQRIASISPVTRARSITSPSEFSSGRWGECGMRGGSTKKWPSGILTSLSLPACGSAKNK